MAVFALPKIDISQINIPQIDIPQIDLPAINLSDSLTSINTFVSQIQTILAAAFNHPFLAVGSIIIGIGLIQLIADLVKRILRTGIKLVLTLPLTLSQWLWKKATAPKSDTADEKTRIERLLNRLDTLHAEQEQVMTELKTLINTASTTNEMEPEEIKPNETKPSPQSATSEALSVQKSVEPPQY